MRIHEYAGRVALKVKDAETQYLTTKEAAQLATELAHAASQIKMGYHYETRDLNP